MSDNVLDRAFPPEECDELNLLAVVPSDVLTGSYGEGWWAQLRAAYEAFRQAT